MSEGIHHVTAVTRRVQANVDFYAGFLGLRLVKQTGGFEDGEQLHLFYGDAAGSPGSLITFLVWEDGAAGRVGHGQIGEIALAVPPHSIGDWLSRALAAGVPHEGGQVMKPGDKYYNILRAWIAGGMNPFKFFYGVREPFVVAFSTASSNATLPVSLRVAETELKLPSRLSRNSTPSATEAAPPARVAPDLI